MQLWIFLCVKSFCAYTNNFDFPTDTMFHSRINEYMNTYFETFTITDEFGKYDLSRELKFLALFDDDALIFNFLPDLKTSYQQISVDEYLITVRHNFKDKIIRPGLYTWHVQSVSPISENHQYLIKALIQKRIIVYDQDNIATQSIDDWDLVVTFLADKGNNALKIIGIQNTPHAAANLSIRVLYPNREPAKMKSIEIEYYDPELKRRVKRDRMTNSDGLLTLSNVSERSKIKIQPAERNKNLLPATMRAGHWNNLPHDNRFLVISDKAGFFREPQKHQIQGGTRLQIPLFPIDFHHALTPEDIAMPNIEYLPHTDLYINYSRHFFFWKGFGVSAASGIEYHYSTLKSSHDQMVYLLHPTNADAEKIDVDTMLIKITGEKYKHTAWGIPFIFSLNYYTQNRLFTGGGIGFRTRFAIIDRYNYDLQTNQYPSDVDLHTSTPEIYLHSTSGSFKQSNRLDFSIDLSLLFNVYKDIVHLQYLASYNLHNIGNQKKAYTLPEDQTETGIPYSPFFNNNKFHFYNITMGLGIAYRF